MRITKINIIKDLSSIATWTPARNTHYMAMEKLQLCRALLELYDAQKN